MPNYWFCCKKCTQVIKKDTSPNTSGCSKASYHEWIKIGEFGEINYSCKKCGLIVQTKNAPNTSGCSSSSYHEWHRL